MNTLLHENSECLQIMEWPEGLPVGRKLLGALEHVLFSHVFPLAAPFCFQL